MTTPNPKPAERVRKSVPAPVTPAGYCPSEFTKNRLARAVRKFYMKALRDRLNAMGFKGEIFFHPHGTADYGEVHLVLHREGLPVVEVVNRPGGMFVRRWEGDAYVVALDSDSLAQAVLEVS